MASGEFLRLFRISRACSMRHQEVNRLFTPKAGSNPRESPLFLEFRSHGRLRSPCSLGVARHFAFYFVVGCVEALATRDFIDHDGRRYRFAGRVPLTFSKLV